MDGGGWRMPAICELKGPYRKGAGRRNMATPFILETAGWGLMVDRSKFQPVDFQGPMEEAG